ncbi:MAG: radical SAM family heme chaperone HemW [Angelakisella sp.]
MTTPDQGQPAARASRRSTTPVRSAGLLPIPIYLHVPFCKSRCRYCDFYSTTRLDQLDAYTDALIRAIAAAPLDNRTAETIYFGGGTPSLLGVRLLDILSALRQRLPILPGAEITLEANPGTVDFATLSALRQGGFNRISFGLQSNRDSTLRQLGRAHNASQGVQAVELARQAGFDNISVDLMLGLPGQDSAAVQELCQMAIDLHAPHLSAYLLQVEPGTPFWEEGIAALCPDPDQSADLYLAACDCLKAAGYRHYEISNFALPGYESRHNSAYWRLTDYLGIGPGAHSLLGTKRFYFPSDLDGFLAAPTVWDTLVPDGDGGGWEEYVMLSLRLREGLSLEHLSRCYGLDSRQLQARAKPLVAEGLAEVMGDRLFLTDRGFLVSNSVINFLTNGL